MRRVMYLTILALACSNAYTFDKDLNLTDPSELDLPVMPPDPNKKKGPPPLPVEQVEPTPEPPSFGGNPISAPTNTLIYVIDISCSMIIPSRYLDENGNAVNGTRLDKAKMLTCLSIARLDETYKFNVVAYSCSMLVWRREGLAQATPENKVNAINWVRSMLYPNGGTGTGQGVITALVMDRNNRCIILLTDGSPSCGEPGNPIEVHKSMIRSNNTQNASIHVFGIGATGVFRQFCQDVAAGNCGQYYDMPDY